MNKITMTLQVDHLILEALKEDISSEDVTTNSAKRTESLPDWKFSAVYLHFWMLTQKWSCSARMAMK